jgi:hypothetical protein
VILESRRATRDQRQVRTGDGPPVSRTGRNNSSVSEDHVTNMPDLSAALSVLRSAIQVNPRLQIALGVAGLGAVVSTVLTLVGGDRELAVIGGAFVVGFMFILSVFVTITSADGTTQRPYLATTLIWSISAIFIASLSLVISSYFFCWPQPFGRSCQALKITDIDFLRSDGVQRIVEKDEAYFVIPHVARHNQDYFLDHLDGGVFFIGFLVEGMSIAAGGATDVFARVTLTADGPDDVISIRETTAYPSIDDWRNRHIPIHVGLSKFPSEMNAAGFHLNHNTLPIVVAIGCLRDRDHSPPKTLMFRVEAFDQKAGTYATRLLTASINPSSSAAAEPTQNCPNA